MKIVVNGGLGNQLFQIAYAHQGLKNTNCIEIYRDSNPRPDRPFELDESSRFADIQELKELQMNFF